MHTARYSWPFEFNNFHEPEMKNLYSKKLILFVLIINLVSLFCSQELKLKQINEYGQTGKTLSLSVALKFPFPNQPIEVTPLNNVNIDRIGDFT